MKRREILEQAITTICNDRQDQYGAPEDSFARIADLWEVYLNHKNGIQIVISPADAAMMMVLFKIARTIGTPPKEDTFVDVAGYAANAGELAL